MLGVADIREVRLHRFRLKIDVVRSDERPCGKARLQQFQHRQVKFLPAVQEDKRHASSNILKRLERVPLTQVDVVEQSRGTQVLARLLRFA